MADFVTLSCPTCGGKLEITKEIDKFACGHCGNEHVVNRGGGIVSINPVDENIQLIARSTEKTASELAIARMKSEVEFMLERSKSIFDELKSTANGATEFYYSYINANDLKAVSIKKRVTQIEEASIAELEKTLEYIQDNKKLSKKRSKSLSFCKDILYIRNELNDKLISLRKHEEIVDG